VSPGQAIKSSKLEGIFEYNLSMDAVKAYKPDARAYQMAIDGIFLSNNWASLPMVWVLH
jgi:hypothetical protein